MIFRKAEDEHEVGRRNVARGFFRPFNQTDRVVAEILAQTSIDKLFRVVETIKIKVIPVYARNYVNFNQRVGRAFHRPVMSQLTEHRAHQRCLACTKIPVQPHHRACVKQRRQASSQRDCRGLIGQRQG